MVFVEHFMYVCVYVCVCMCSGGFSNLGAQGEHSIDNPLGTVSPEARRGGGGGGASRNF